MALSEVTLTITDGALGIVPEAIDGISAKIGCSSLGTINSVYSFSDIKTLTDTLGVGPLVEAAAHLLSISGGPVYCVPATHSTEGSAGSITKSGSGPTVTVAGNSTDVYEAQVVIVAGGALGAGTFKYTLDGGDNFSPVYTIPSGGTFLMPGTGLTLTFPSGTYVAAETYTFASTAPMYDNTALNSALTGLLADPREWRFLHVVGQGANVAGCATMAATVATALGSAATAYRYTRAIVECPDDTDVNIIAGLASTSNVRVMIAAGFCELTSQVTGRSHKRHAAWPMSARMALAPVHEDLGRFASGSLPGVTRLYRDERATPGLDAQRVATLRTFIGQPGFYITAGRTTASTVSDYQLIQNGFVMDKACRIIRTALLRFLNDSVNVNATTGYIQEEDAQNIENYVLGLLESGLIAPGNASAVTVKVARNNNILSSMTLLTTERIVPKGYARFITADVGLYNPALTPVAA